MITDLISSDLAGTIIAFALTLFVFSYILGDNALFRTAIHIFIGVAAGYTSVLILRNLVWEQMIQPILDYEGNLLNLTILIIPLLLSIMLLTKIHPRLSTIGTPVMALVVGVGAATVIGGAVSGTLFPQSAASMNLFEARSQTQGEDLYWLIVIEGLFMLIGTLSTLIYTQFSTRFRSGAEPTRGGWLESIAGVGKTFIAVTFGALFAGVLLSAITALVERWSFIVSTLLAMINY